MKSETTMKQQWNDESGDWRGWENDDQRPRYEAITAQIKRLRAKSVLDIGCGEAVLFSLMPAEVRQYLGIEPSQLALKGAQSRQASVVRQTAEGYVPDSAWDCIIFNEVLYYTADPIGLLRKYARALTPDGFIIVSIYQRPGSPSLSKRVRHWMDRRRPMSNVHCTQMLQRFISTEGWKTHHAGQVRSSENDFCWSVFTVTPGFR